MIRITGDKLEHLISALEYTRDTSQDNLNGTLETIATENQSPSPLTTPDDFEIWEKQAEKFEADITALNELIEGLKSDRLHLIDTRSVCMVQNCNEAARFIAVIQVHAHRNPAPLAQMQTNPAIFVCEHHATANIDDYLPINAWRDIQAAVAKQMPGTLVRKDDARLMFLDMKADPPVLVPAPNKGRILLATGRDHAKTSH